MPVNQSIRDYITRELSHATRLSDFETQFEIVLMDIASLLAPRPDDARHTAAWLAYFLSVNYMRSGNEAPQRTYAEILTSAFRRLYNDTRFTTRIGAAQPRHSYPLLLSFYHLHHAFIMNGLRAPTGPETLDHGDALRMLRIIVSTLHGPWLSRIHLQRGIRDYHHARIVDDALGTRIELGRLPSTTTHTLRVASWNMQGSSQTSDAKWRTFVLPLARNNAVVALQEAGSRPASADYVGNIAVTDQFGTAFQVEQYLWEAGSTSRPERYQLFFLDVQRLRVSLAMLVADSPGLEVVTPVVISDGLPDAQGAPIYRPALGLQMRHSATSAQAVTLYNFHAISGGGVNAPRMLREVSWHTPTRFAVTGDFNRDPRPETPAWPTRRGNWISPPDIAQLLLPDTDTHPSTNPRSLLDYAVINGTGGRADCLSTVGPSDHLAVCFRFELPD